MICKPTICRIIWLSQILINWKNFKHIVILDFPDLKPNTLNSDQLKKPKPIQEKKNHFKIFCTNCSSLAPQRYPRLATQCSLLGDDQARTLLWLTSQQWPSAWRQGSTHGQEWTQASGNTLSFTPSIACWSTSDLFCTRTSHEESFRKAGSSQAARSSHHTYLLLPGIDSRAEQRLNAAGRTPEVGNPSTMWIRRNYVLTRTDVVSPPRSAWHCKLLTAKPENRRLSCVPKTIPLSLWK